MEFGKLEQTQAQLPGEVFKTALGERNVDLYQRWRVDSQGQGRKQVLAGLGRSIGGNLLDWAIKNVGNYILNSALTLYTMDWNKTDQEIEAQIKANETVIATQLGQLSANTLVYSVGIGFTAKAATKYPVIAGRTALLVAEEGGEEIRASIRSFLTSTRNATASSTILSTYLTGRRLLFGAQKDKREPWIASDRLDKIIESNKDANIRAYWNGFKDQLEDAILDLGVIINMGWLEQYELQKAQKSTMLGKSRIIELVPDKTKPNEAVYMMGRTQNLIPQISNAIATSRLLQSKDVGEIVGSSALELQIADDQTRILHIYYINTENRSSRFFKDGVIQKARTSVMKIGNIKPGLTFTELKAATENYQRGNTIVTAILSNKRQMQIYCTSKADGKSIINKMVALTNLEVIKWSYSEQDPNNPKSKKEVEMMYPYRAILEVRRPTAVDSEVKYRDRKGQGYKVERAKGKLWVAEELSGWETIVG